jgi:hypothetical protein
MKPARAKRLDLGARAADSTFITRQEKARMPKDDTRIKLQGVRRSLQAVEKRLAEINGELLRDTAAGAATRIALERVIEALHKVLEALGDQQGALQAVPVTSGVDEAD